MNKNAVVFCDVFGMVKARKSGSLEDMDNAIRQRGNKDLRTETDKILDPSMQVVQNFDFEKIDDAELMFANYYFNLNNDFAHQLFTRYQNNILPH